MKASDLSLSIGLGLAMLALSYARIWGDTGSALFNSGIVETVAGSGWWTGPLGTNVLRFACTQILLHASLGFVCLLMASISRIALPGCQLSIRTWLLAWFLVASSWMLFANAVVYPWSSATSPYASFFSRTGGDEALIPLSYFIVAISIGVLLLATIRFFAGSAKNGQLPLVSAWTLLIAGCGSLLTPISFSMAVTDLSAGKPNVILIGMDSLRRDRVTGSRILMPNLKAYVDESASFADTLTPLARTFPAWISILTGRHPHSTGAVENLLSRNLLDVSQSLPNLLQTAGYRTVFATDESRFANIDDTYSFDRVVSPPMGSTEFLLAFFADTPLSNLIANTHLGRFLFPYSHANRAATVTYMPETFTSLVANTIDQERTPLFLAMHLTLAHQPYIWARSADLDQPESSLLESRYEHALAELDKQFADIVEALSRAGVLENAIVILFSDHGESLAEPAPTPAPAGPAQGSEYFLGHGNSILAHHENQVIFGIRTYGQVAAGIRRNEALQNPASLEDIAPTVLELLGLHTPTYADGFSLAPILRSEQDASGSLANRIRFVETGFTPNDIGYERAKAFGKEIKRAASYYRVDPNTDRVLFRDEFLGEVLLNREYGAISGDRMLASIPAADGAGQRVVALRRSGLDDGWHFDGSDPAKDPELLRLWSALERRFTAVPRQPRALSAGSP